MLTEQQQNHTVAAMAATFSVGNVLGKAPGEAKLEDVYKLDKQLGEGSLQRGPRLVLGLLIAALGQARLRDGRMRADSS